MLSISDKTSVEGLFTLKGFVNTPQIKLKKREPEEPV